MSNDTASPWGARLFIALGLGVLGVELWRYWWLTLPIGWPVFIGAALGFIGFYMLYPVGAKDGAGFLVQSTVTILGALPFVGRRATDAIARRSLERQEQPVLGEPTLLSGAGGDTVILVPGLTTEPSIHSDDESGT